MRRQQCAAYVHAHVAAANEDHGLGGTFHPNESNHGGGRAS